MAPSTLHTNAYAFGRSKQRGDIVRSFKNFPSPSNYIIGSQFNDMKKTKGYSFGLHWNKYKRVYLDYAQQVDNTFPGPVL